MDAAVTSYDSPETYAEDGAARTAGVFTRLAVRCGVYPRNHGHEFWLDSISDITSQLSLMAQALYMFLNGQSTFVVVDPSMGPQWEQPIKRQPWCNENTVGITDGSSSGIAGNYGHYSQEIADHVGLFDGGVQIAFYG
jgi:hypothetical protein